MTSAERAVHRLGSLDERALSRETEIRRVDSTRSVDCPQPVRPSPRATGRVPEITLMTSSITPELTGAPAGTFARIQSSVQLAACG